MNKRYIDFVPKKTAASATPARSRVSSPNNTAAPRPQVSLPDGSAARVVTHQVSEEIRLEEIFEERPAASQPNFGVIEDFSGKFVSNPTDKRPLGTATSAAAKDLKAAKSKKIPRIPLIRGAKKPEPTPPTKPATEPAASDQMKIPVRPFINAEKVTKRPLSRNVYKPRQIPIDKAEEPKGTVTIIEKPEKDSRISLIITIIITIILGAAAGTVAFLLLPK
ncbi:hypothetical protein IKG68_01800 [Candidatus Saccharibacteria bacterium]|nr:hypothetical protein [Candidatus Saccharibacteria bacterium]